MPGHKPFADLTGDMTVERRGEIDALADDLRRGLPALQSPMHEHPIAQRIRAVLVTPTIGYFLGTDGVTRIEACTKSGLHADIAYLRVWRGDACAAEFCQHNVVATEFLDEPREG